jgi:membrane protein implicated in regulation of membrane protease activity
MVSTREIFYLENWMKDVKVLTVVFAALFLALLSLAWATSFIVFVILATALTDVTRRSTK